MADIEFIVEGDGGFLSGNEAVARGVLEAGVSVGTSYPCLLYTSPSPRD